MSKGEGEGEEKGAIKKPKTDRNPPNLGNLYSLGTGKTKPVPCNWLPIGTSYHRDITAALPSGFACRAGLTPDSNSLSIRESSNGEHYVFRNGLYTFSLSTKPPGLYVIANGPDKKDTTWATLKYYDVKPRAG